jgi:hypothetical protein
MLIARSRHYAALMLRAITACCVRRRTGDSGAAAPLRRARARRRRWRRRRRWVCSVVGVAAAACSFVGVATAAAVGGGVARVARGHRGLRPRSIPLGYIAPWIECHCLHQPGLWVSAQGLTYDRHRRGRHPTPSSHRPDRSAPGWACAKRRSKHRPREPRSERSTPRMRRTARR